MAQKIKLKLNNGEYREYVVEHFYNQGTDLKLHVNSDKTVSVAWKDILHFETTKLTENLEKIYD